MPYISMLSSDRSVIPYRKELNAATGGVTSTILLQQIIYWWEQSGRQPFYKFIEPCGHEQYQDGDSWVEETGLSRKEFLTAIKRLEAAGLVRKKTNSSRVTYYSLHEKELEAALKGIYVNAERGFTKMPKGDLPNKTETTKDISSRSSLTDQCKEVIDYLNIKAGTSFRLAESHKRTITARLNEGATVEEMKRVIDAKCAEWLNDPKMKRYLQPSTLFRASKYDNYVGALSNDFQGGTDADSDDYMRGI